MGNCLKNVKIIGFLTFSETLYIKECVKGAFYPFRAKSKQFPLISLEK